MANKTPNLKDIKSGVSLNFLQALTLLFIGLKLGNVIAWSWWWVLLPLWGPFVLILLLAIVFVVFTAVAESRE